MDIPGVEIDPEKQIRDFSYRKYPHLGGYDHREMVEGKSPNDSNLFPRIFRDLMETLEGPMPSITARQSSIQLGAGEEAVIDLTVSNTGKPADVTYVDVSVSENITILRGTPDGRWMKYPTPDQPLIFQSGDRDEPTLRPQFVLYELVESEFPEESQTYEIHIRKTDNRPGWIKYRVSMLPLGLEETGPNFQRDPLSGIRDKQGWFAKEITISPVDLPPPPTNAHWTESISPDTVITAQWNPVAGAVNYHLQIDKDSTDFSSGMAYNGLIHSSNPQFTFSKAEDGHAYYFRVKAIDAQDKEGEYSAISDSIEIDAPQEGLGLADTPHPTFRHDSQRTGRSQYSGPAYPALSWKFNFETKGVIESSASIGGDGTIYVGSNRHLYAISPDGTLKWKFNAGSISDGPSIGSDGTIYVGAIDKLGNYLYAISPDGTLKWKFKTMGSPAIGSDGTIYVGAGSLRAISPNGVLKWALHLSGITTPSIGTDGTIYVGTWLSNYHLYAISPDGTLKWKFKTVEWVSTPSIGTDGTLYVGSGDNHLYAISPDGTLKWKFKTVEWVSTPSIGTDGTLYVVSGLSRNLYAISPNGNLKWKIKFDAVMSHPSIGSDGTLYMGSMDSDLYAISPDGTLKWKFDTGPGAYGLSPRSIPIINSDGTIYVGARPYLYAIGAGSPTLIINHEPVKSIKIGDKMTITANVTGEPKPVKLVVFYRNPIESDFKEAEMKNMGGRKWEVVLSMEISNNTTGVLYYIKAQTDFPSIEATAPDASAKQKTYGVAIEGLTLSSQSSIPSSAYTMVSVPLSLRDENPLSLLEDSLGEQSIASWRLFGYNASNGSYIENQTLEHGRGYWLFSRESKPISIKGTTANPAQDFTITLSKGWNLIGNPYAFDVYWGNTVIKVSGKEYNINESEVNQYVRQKYWWYEDATGDYVNNGVFELERTPFDATHKLHPWRGYAIYALEDSELIISPSQDEPQLAPVVIQAPSQMSPFWQVQLIAKSGNTIDSTNYLGVYPSASDGYDRGDAEKPPFPSDRVSFSFPHLDWDRDANQYATDYKSPFEKEKSWHATVTSSNKGTAVQLRWNHINKIPSHFNAYFMDEVSGAIIDMRQDSGYSYKAEFDRDVREIQILVTTQKLETRPGPPVTNLLLQNYPNPFNPETWVPYHLSESGHVVIRIYNVPGQLVKTIELGFKHAGYYDTRSRAAYWDGLNDNGEQVSSGIYFYQITVGSFSSMKKMVIVR